MIRVGRAVQPELREKSVRFQIEIVALSESVIPEIDDEFVRDFGIADGDIAALRKEVAANMSREMYLVIKSKVKDQVLDGLLSANPISVPSALVEEVADRLISNAAQEGRDTRGISRDQFRDRAARRVSLGLLIAEIVKLNRISGDPARVRSTIELIASSYEEPEQVVKWYYGDRELLSGIEALVLEDQVVDWLLERAKVQEIPSSFQALMNPALSA